MAGSKSKSTLMMAGAGALGLGALLLLFYQSFWGPYTELKKELAKAEEELEAKDKEFREFNAKKRKLERARVASFPVNVKYWATDYQTYLRYLARNFKGTDAKEKGAHVIAPTAMGDVKAPQGSKRIVPEQVIRTPWTVQGKATWPVLVAFLENFQQTPLLHRIKTIHVERATGTSEKEEKKEFVDELAVTITIDTLSLPGKQRADNLWGIDARVLAVDAFAGLGLGMPGWNMLWNAQVLMLPEAPPNRKYDVLAQWRNPFRGGMTDAEISKEYLKNKKDSGVVEDEEFPLRDGQPIKADDDIRRFVRLTMNVETTNIIKVLVKPAGAAGAGGGGFRGGFPQTVALDGDEPVGLARDKNKAVEVIVDLMTKKGDHRADRVDSVFPAGMGLTAEITARGNLKVTAGKDVAEGVYQVKIKAKRATLRNMLADDYTTLSTRAPYDSFLVRSLSLKEQARGKILHIDQADVYFLSRDVTLKESKEAIYRIHNGETVFDALQRPVTAGELQQLDWWALSPLATSTVGLLGAPGPGSLLAGFAVYPGRPGLRNPADPAETVDAVAK